VAISPFWDEPNWPWSWEDWLGALLRTRRLLGQISAWTWLPLYNETDRVLNLTLVWIQSCVHQLMARVPE
jgi:hypothetical protein